MKVFLIFKYVHLNVVYYGIIYLHNSKVDVVKIHLRQFSFRAFLLASQRKDLPA